MRKLFVFIAVCLLSTGVFAQSYWAVEQRPNALTFFGGIYFQNGMSVQAQFINQPGGLWLAGYSWTFGQALMEINSGGIVTKDESRLTHIPLQFNMYVGNDTTLFNFLLINEIDNSIDKQKYPAATFFFHHYLVRVLDGIYVGGCLESYLSTDYKELYLGPLVKYWANPTISVSVGVRAKTSGEEINVEKLQLHNFYVNVTQFFNW